MTIHCKESPRDYVLGETYHVAGPRAYMRSKIFLFLCVVVNKAFQKTIHL